MLAQSNIPQSLQTLLQIQAIQLINLLNTKQRRQFQKFVQSTFYIFQQTNINIEQIKQSIQWVLQLCNQSQQQSNCYVVDDILEWQIYYMVILYKVMGEKFYRLQKGKKFFIFFCINMKQISESSIDFMQIIQHIQNWNQKQTQFLKLLRLLPLAKKKLNVQKYQSIQSQQNYIQKQLKTNIKYIFQQYFRCFQQKQPNIQFVKLNNKQSKVINFFFSGFGSQKTCKITQWSQLPNQMQQESYSISWQSKTFQDILLFLKEQVQVNNYIPASVSLGLRLLITAGKFIVNFKDNPFYQAYEHSKITGYVIAQLLIHYFHDRYINLIGFSLGTELIKNIMIRLSQKNKLHILNRIYLLGGVADKQQIQEILKKSINNLTIYNFYTANDYALSYLLKIVKSNIKPIGLNKIDNINNHTIINQDCSVYVNGHIDYRNKLEVIYGKIQEIQAGN